MEKKLVILTAALVAILAEEKALLTAAGDKPLSPDDVKKHADIVARFEATDAEVKRLEAAIAREDQAAKPLPRVTNPAAAETRITGGEPAGAAPGTWGFRTLGEQMSAVRKAALGQGVDNRLMAAATTYGNEATNADGGYAVAPDFRSAIMKKVAGEESLLSMCDQIETSSNRIEVPQDNTTPWGTAGIQAYWDNEAAAMTQKKPALGKFELPLHRLTCLVPITDELLEDAPLVASYTPSKAGEVITSRVNDAIVNGTGAGQPQGLLSAASLVSVAKEGAQSAATVVFDNVVKMWARLHSSLKAGAVWLVNPDVQPQLLNLKAPGGYLPAYLGPNGLTDSPYGTLLGRPVIEVEPCQTLGTKGDLLLVNLKSYAAGVKSGGLKSAASMHLYFDQNITAFRFVLRLGGQSWWSAAVSPSKGSNTRTNIVSLDTRA